MQTEARIFKALADETRLRILVLLLEGELCVCEIIAALEVPQSTTSRHLAYLKRAGWVQDRRQGVWMYYRLTSGDEALQGLLRDILQHALAQNPLAIDDRNRLARFRHEHLQQGA